MREWCIRQTSKISLIIFAFRLRKILDKVSANFYFSWIIPKEFKFQALLIQLKYTFLITLSLLNLSATGNDFIIVMYSFRLMSVCEFAWNDVWSTRKWEVASCRKSNSWLLQLAILLFAIWIHCLARIGLLIFFWDITMLLI